MAKVNIFLFGRFHLGDDMPECPASVKTHMLLSYLLLMRHQMVSRAHLAQLLWPDYPPEQARKYLRQSLWQLQSRLQICYPEKPIITVEADGLGIHPNAREQTDACLFRDVLHRLQDRNGYDMTASEARLLAETITLYTSDLLEGWHVEWVEVMRHQYHQLYLQGLEKLIRYSEANNLFEEGVHFANQVLRHEPAHEATHQHLMRLHYHGGNRTAALRQFERCRAALEAELAVAPSPETYALYEQIKDDSVAHFVPDHDNLAQLLAQVSQLQLILNNLQTQIVTHMEYLNVESAQEKSS